MLLTASNISCAHRFPQPPQVLHFVPSHAQMTVVRSDSLQILNKNLTLAKMYTFHPPSFPASLPRPSVLPPPSSLPILLAVPLAGISPLRLHRSAAGVAAGHVGRPRHSLGAAAAAAASDLRGQARAAGQPGQVLGRGAPHGAGGERIRDGVGGGRG